LNYTYSINNSVDLLNKWFGENNFGFREQKDNKFSMFVGKDYDLTEQKFDNIIKVINNLGWYPSYYIEFTIGYTNSYKFEKNEFLNFIKTKDANLYFEAKYDLGLSQMDLGNVAYHITPLIYKEKIMKIGLAPKSKSKIADQPSRIYLCYTKNDAKLLLDHPKFYSKEKEFVLFEINLDSLFKSRKMRFFEDPNFVNKGYYTYENIPPQYIKEVEVIHR
jgi:hypothetical protein